MPQDVVSTAPGLALLVAFAVGAPAVAAHAAFAPDATSLTLVAPATEGGGWDQTARAMQRVLQNRHYARSVQVVNSPGAGGAIGLAQFVNAQRGNGNTLLLGGLVMLSAIRANRATVSILETTPVARLTGEYEVIAVPGGSELRTLDDLVQALRADPGQVSWAGGSAGGADQVLIALIAGAIDVEPLRMNYVPFSGGGEVADALASNRFTAGVSGYGELEPYLRSGRLRALGISSERRVAGIAVPTLAEQGIDVALANWRGVFAPPGITRAQRDRLIALLDAMVKDVAWQEALGTHHWSDLYLSGDDFERFVREEQARADAGPDPRGMTDTGRPAAIWSRGRRAFYARPIRSMLVLGLALALGTLLVWQHATSRTREERLNRDLADARLDAARRREEARDLLRGLGEQIERQFEEWGLTSAEREVAMLMLKGLRHKEIASMRGTSERTVRQQALTIYRKAGLGGRSDLAAFFLEDILAPMDVARTGAA